MGRAENGTTSALQVSEDIVPSGELKAQLAEKLRGLRGTRPPLVVTRSGRAAAVMLAPEDIERLTNQARFIAAIQDGLGDLDAGRVVRDADLRRRLDARFGAIDTPARVR